MLQNTRTILLLLCFAVLATPLTAVAEGTATFGIQILPGGESVAQVIIHSISDAVVPTIKASVTISNESTTDYEYDYQWCVVSSENNDCGGGDDVFSALAAKFIHAGEDWNTTLEATVPNAGNYWFKLLVSWDLGSSGSFITFTAEEEDNPPSGGGGGGGGGGSGGGDTTSSASKAIFQGVAYPSAEVTILKDGQKVKTAQANSFAGFQAEVSNLNAGSYLFTLRAKDTDRRKSLNLSYPLEIESEETTTVSNIFFPPTISLENNSVGKNEVIKAFGQSVPGKEVSLFINPGSILRKTISSEDGRWNYSFGASALREGAYQIKASAVFQSLTSTFSQVLPFGVGEAVPLTVGSCVAADFNKDDKVNLVDFSIFLSWWGKEESSIDLNKNGNVDLADFSIFLSCWTG